MDALKPLRAFSTFKRIQYIKTRVLQTAKRVFGVPIPLQQRHTKT